MLGGFVRLAMAAALLAAAAGAAQAGEAPAPGPEGAPAKRAFRFLAVADTHFASLEKSSKSLAAFKEFLAGAKPLGADFLVVLGDVCGEDRPALAQAGKIAEESGLKAYFVSGNHDDSDGNKPEDFEKGLGPIRYSFDHKGWHFVGHWSQKPDLKWLEADLAKRPADSPVIYWAHYGPTGKLRDLLEKQGVALAMSGHVHGFRSGMNGKLRDVTLDTFGAGFAVVDVFQDRRIRIAWRPRGINKALTIVHPADGAEVAPGKTTVVVNAFDSFRDVVKVECDDGSGPKAMKQDTDRSWSAEMELRGAGKLQVRAADSSGEAWTAESAWRAAAAAPVVKPGTDWPVWGGTPDNRRSTADRVAPPLRLAWRAAVGGRCAQPVLSGGRLFVCTSTQDFEENNAVVCLEAATGKELWRARLDGSPLCPPAAAGKVVGAIDRFGRAYGFDAASGKELWRVGGIAGTYSTYSLSGMITAADGVFYAGNLHALAAADGKQLWKAEVAQYPNRPPAIAGGRILGSGTGWQKCLDLKDGRELWRSPGSTYRASLWVEDGGLLGGRSLVKAADGSALQTFKAAGNGPDAAVSPDGKTLLVASPSGTAGAAAVTALGLADGKVLWTAPLKGAAGLSALSASPGFAWFCAGDGRLCAVDLAKGKEAWSCRFGARQDAPVASGNAVFVAGDDGCVYGLAGAGSGEAK